MKSNPTFLALAVAVIGVAAVPAFSVAQKKPAPKKPAPKVATLTYKKDIGPAMTANCAGCHTGAKGKAGLDLSSYAGVMKGNKEGKIVVAGNPAKSMLCGVLHGKPKLMPPGKALDAKAIAAVELWVKQGAKEK
jgi:mono/diheme cytochrome c family protein